jgi:hypothetical protein
MAEKKGSKNSIENRGSSNVLVCEVCNSKIQPYRLVGSGKARMVYECECGMFDKSGAKI